jgi:hypothetical protein
MDTRETNGRFSPGNSGGPGRPPRQTEAAYLRITTAACSLEEWREIVTKTVADAKTGNAKAREFLARFLLGAAPILSDLASWDEAGHDPINEKIKNARLHKMLAS